MQKDCSQGVRFGIALIVWSILMLSACNEKELPQTQSKGPGQKTSEHQGQSASQGDPAHPKEPSSDPSVHSPHDAEPITPELATPELKAEMQKACFSSVIREMSASLTVMEKTHPTSFEQFESRLFLWPIDAEGKPWLVSPIPAGADLQQLPYCGFWVEKVGAEDLAVVLSSRPHDSRAETAYSTDSVDRASMRFADLEEVEDERYAQAYLYSQLAKPVAIFAAAFNEYPATPTECYTWLGLDWKPMNPEMKSKLAKSPEFFRNKSHTSFIMRVELTDGSVWGIAHKLQAGVATLKLMNGPSVDQTIGSMEFWATIPVQSLTQGGKP